MAEDTLSNRPKKLLIFCFPLGFGNEAIAAAGHAKDDYAFSVGGYAEGNNPVVFKFDQCFELHCDAELFKSVTTNGVFDVKKLRDRVFGDIAMGISCVGLAEEPLKTSEPYGLTSRLPLSVLVDRGSITGAGRLFSNRYPGSLSGWGSATFPTEPIVSPKLQKYVARLSRT